MYSVSQIQPELTRSGPWFIDYSSPHESLSTSNLIFHRGEDVCKICSKLCCLERECARCEVHPTHLLCWILWTEEIHNKGLILYLTRCPVSALVVGTCRLQTGYLSLKWWHIRVHSSQLLGLLSKARDTITPSYTSFWSCCYLSHQSCLSPLS